MREELRRDLRPDPAIYLDRGLVSHDPRDAASCPGLQVCVHFRPQRDPRRWRESERAADSARLRIRIRRMPIEARTHDRGARREIDLPAAGS